MTIIENMGARAKAAARILSCAGTNEKNQALLAIADALEENRAEIIEANEVDLANGRSKSMTESLLDRLELNESRIRSMADGVRDVASLQDPIGEVISGYSRPNGLRIQKVRVPLGVIGIIFEARPNVTSDAAALCLKAGNACILRGGKEAINSNLAIMNVMRRAVEKAGLPADCIQLVEDTSRESAAALMKLDKYLDVLIPRGGAGLIRAVVENSTVPVIETGVGNCHVYVDAGADINMAASIIFNAKTSRPSVCNAIETILINKEIADSALPAIKRELDRKNVEIRGCDRTREILGDCVKPATNDDYSREFLDYIIACKVVDSIDEAIEHIANYSSGHSECIITNDYNSQVKFTAQVDAAVVYVNSSTRFTDGGEMGLGAEIGISTQKLHARGPMGLRELTSCKFIVHGDGQTR